MAFLTWFGIWISVGIMVACGVGGVIRTGSRDLEKMDTERL